MVLSVISLFEILLLRSKTAGVAESYGACVTEVASEFFLRSIEKPGRDWEASMVVMPCVKGLAYLNGYFTMMSI